MPHFDDYGSHIFYNHALASYGKELHVYVDGSFDTDEERGKRAKQSIGVGWAVANGKNRLVGYGAALTYGNHTPCSSTNELRAIVSFLEKTAKYFPNLDYAYHHFVIHCDNKNLMEDLINGTKSAKIRKANLAYFGRDYRRLLSYMGFFNLSFRWIKGHSTNPFNRFADIIGRRLRVAAKNDIELVGTERLESIKDALLVTELLHPQDMSHKQLMRYIRDTHFKEFHKIPTIWVETHKTKVYGDTLLSIAYDSNVGEFRGHRFNKFSRDIDELEMSLRAVRITFEKYRKDELFDTRRSFVIRVETEAIARILNMIAKDSVINYRNVETLYAQELELLKEQMNGLVFLAVHDGLITEKHNGKEWSETLKDKTKKLARKQANRYLDSIHKAQSKLKKAVSQD